MSSILTSLQIKVLGSLSNERGLLENFYWTGGTVLSEFYLKHRLSEDIDLFSESEVNVLATNSLIEKLRKSTEGKNINYTNYLGLHTYSINYTGNQNIKIDFNYYPFPRIEKGGMYKSISYDSYLDILVNKIQTIYTKPRGRDFVDLYFANKKSALNLKELIKFSKSKFDWHIDPLQLASQLMKAEELYESSRLLIPLDKRKFKELFESWVIQLKSDVIVISGADRRW